MRVLGEIYIEWPKDEASLSASVQNIIGDVVFRIDSDSFDTEAASVINIFEFQLAILHEPISHLDKQYYHLVVSRYTSNTKQFTVSQECADKILKWIVLKLVDSGFMCQLARPG